MNRIIYFSGKLLTLGITIAAGAGGLVHASSCTPPPAGIVAWWPGEGGGSDIVGTNNGTSVGAVGYTSGEVGQAFTFNGNNQLVAVGNSPSLQLQDFSIEAWVKRASASVVTGPGGNGIIFSYGQGGYGLYLDNNGTPALSRIGIDETKPAVSITDTNFHHLAVTKFGSTNIFYVDGTAYPAPAYNPGFVFTTVAAIGGRGDNLDNSFLGDIDEVSVYSRALSSSEVAAIFQAGSAGKCQSSLIAPVITAQPTNLTVAVSNTAVFTVTATGAAPLSYQWSFNGTNLLVGATNATLILPNVQLAQAGRYSVLVSNAAGSTNSATAVLAVQTPTPPSCTPPPAGIAAWWQSEGNANDIIGGNNGAPTGGVTYASGEVGQAFVFNHTDSYIPVPASSNLDIGTKGTGITIECWVMPDAYTLSSWGAPIIEWDAATNGLQLFVYQGSLFANVRDTLDGNHSIQTAAGIFSASSFQHVALTYDKSSGLAVLYLNGAVVATNNFGSITPQTSYPVNIGRRTVGYAAGATYGGLMDELSLYSRALSSGEIAAIYGAGSAGKCTGSPITSSGVPAIYNFSPASGPDGATVTVSGTNFSPSAAANIVYFGAVRANVLTASPNSLSVTVPAGASYAPITVTVNGMTAWANAPFMPTFNGASNSLTLAPRLDLPLGNSPGFTILADVDGDGKPDLLVASSQIVSVYRNISTNGALIGAASFAPRVDVPVPGSLQGLVLADVDGDGKLDLVVLDRSVNQVHVLRNVSTPGNIATNSFVLTADLPTGIDPRGLVVRDLDGDGLPDIAVANWADSTVSVFHNLGTTNGITTNSFAAPVIFAVGAQPQDLKAADLDGDGKPDLVTANNNYGTTNSVSILRNTSSAGTISFAAQTGLAGAATSFCVAIGDMDGDGKLDLVVSSFINGQVVSVYRNTSSPGSLTTNSFAPNVDFALGGWGNSVAIGDLDGDGKPDLAVVRQLADGLCIFKNISTPGSFTSASLAPRVDYPAGYNPNGVAIGDVDGDGRPDITFAVTYAATVSVYQNLTSTPTNPPVANPPVISGIAPAAGTIGATITITGNYFSPVAASNIVYFGSVQANVVSAGSTSLTATVPPSAIFGPITVTVGGLTAYSAQMFEPTFNGTGSNITTSSFAPGFNITTPGGPGSMVIADLDGDGKPDLAFVSNDNIVCILRNISTNGALLSAASFAPPVELTFPTNGTSGNAYRVRAVDLDGDGKLDLIACEVNGNRVSVFHNVSTPGILTTNSFEPAFALISGSDCRGVAAADLDADGRVDIVALNYGDKTISVFKNIGTGGGLTAGSFAPPVVLAAPGDPYEVAIADLDGDGRPDLATANAGNNTVSIYQNETTIGILSTNSFPARVDLPGGTNPETIAAVDLDGDGRLDLVVGSVQSDNVNVYRNVSTGGVLTASSFAPEVDFGTPGWMHTVSVADFNGDGKPDIAVVGELGSYMGIFQNTATPGSFTASSFAPMVQFGTGWNAWGVASGDLDGDGRPDVVFCNYYDGNIEIYQNLAPFGTPPPAGPPVVTAIMPNVAVPGTNVTILGNNFSATPAANIVYFGAVKATVTSASPTSLTVTVPAGATYAPITVTVNGLVAYSSQPFVPTFFGASSNLTASSFAPSFNLPGGNGSTHTAVGDLDGDGKPDLVLLNIGDNTIWVYRNIGTNNLLSAASFAPPVIWTMPGTPYSFVLADLDGDGRLDIVVADNQDNNVSVFQNLCTPGSITTNSFAARVDFPVGQQPTGVAVIDLNGDGRPDIVAANFTDSTISVLQNLGSSGGITTNSFSAHVDFATGTTPQSVAVGDLDGDGMPDIATLNYGGNSVSVFRNIAGGGSITTSSLAPRVDLTGAGGGECVMIADLDGDGKPDLLVTAYVPALFSVFQNQSVPGSLTASSFAPRVDFSTGGRAHRVTVGDLDGDGKLDVVVTTELPSQLLIFKNVSSPGVLSVGSLASPVVLPTGWNPNGVSIADLDGDGRPDIYFDNHYDGNISIYQNLVPFGMLSGAPTIISQPTNVTVTVNGTAEFTVVATGTPAPGYQWSFNGTNIIGATSATLILTNVLPAQAGNYSVLVANAAGSVTSSNALLTVYVPPTPPTILSQTPSEVVLLGSSATFGVTATGSDPLSYFWSRSGALIPNATNSVYILSNAQLTDSGSKFICLVTNAYGFAMSTNVSLKVIDTISNDLCSGAVIITSYSYSNLQSTAMASSYGDPVPSCLDSFGNGVWYQFTSPVNGLLSVDTFGSDFDTGLGVYAGSCGALTEVDCDDDANGGVTSQVVFSTVAGTTYYFLAGGYGGHVGNLVFHLNYFTPPAFDVQPTNLAVIVSSNALFNPTVSGSLPMSFQWYFNNAPLADDGRISGSTNVTLGIANVQTTDGGNYQLVASNFVGVTTSSVAILTPVVMPPAFIQLPVSQAVGVGSNANFSATVTGTAPFGYQWYFNGNPLTDDGVHIAGSTTASLNITNLVATDTGSYSLTVTNPAGSTNAAATLTVLLPPVFTVQPVGRSVPPGLPTTFNTVVSGNPTTYQWYLNGTNLPGAITASYAIAAVGSNDLGVYQLVASNVIGVAVSSPAQLTFGPVAAWGRNLNNECLPPPGLSNVIAVAGNLGASFAVRADGTVVSWGTGIMTNVPANATNVVAIATSETGDLALRTDGTVVAWGGSAQPGLTNMVAVAAANGSPNFEFALRAEGVVTNRFLGWGFPAGLNHVTAIAAGYNFALALRSDGTVVATGNNPINTVTNVPANVTNIVAIAAGDTYAMALRANGTVVAWGSGTGTNLPPGMSNIVAITAGNYSENQGMAIRSNGTVVVWGDNNYGEKFPPAALSNLVSVAVSAPAYHGLALVNDGSPQILRPPVGLTANLGRDVKLQATAVGAAPLSYQWLLNGTNIPSATNTSLFMPNIQFANAGKYQLLVSNSVGTATSLAAPVNIVSSPFLQFLGQTGLSATNVYQGGTAKFYGGAVLGNGPLRYQWYSSPTNFNYLPVSGGTNDTLALDPALAVQSGYYYLAASNGFVQLNQTYAITSAPVNLRVQFARAWGYNAVSNPPVNVTNAIAVATGGSSGLSAGHYLALGADGKVRAWESTFSPYGETNVAALSNSFVTAIAASYQQSLALKSDGTVYAWGFGGYGQTNPPSGLNGVVAISCGGYHDLALKSDGTVVGWGDTLQAPVFGQATNNPAATNVVAIAAGNQHSLALRADGTVVAWGYMGDGSTIIPLTATNVIGIAAGSGFSAALRANGTVVQWGSPIVGYPVPAYVSNIVAISASGTHCTALRNDGSVVSWGNGYIGVASNNVPADLANVIAIASGGDHDFGLLGNRAPTFTIQPWNRPLPLPQGKVMTITLAGKCVGVQPMRYQWLLNGTNYPGGTNDTLTLRYDPPSQIPAGAYQLVASNSYGVAITKPAKVSYYVPLGDAVDAPTLAWTTSGNAQWYGQTNYTHDGIDAARSGGIGALQETILQTTLATNVPGNVTFWWKVSSEQFFDILEFRVNGNSLANISGEVDWQQVSIPISAGTNLLQWRYSKDATFDSGLDAGFVDQFAFVSAPQILVQPVSQTVNHGVTVNLSVLATGAPTLGYQWSQNGSPVGGNSPNLVLSNVGRAQDGIYSVTVSNGGGVAVSSNAVLHVNVPQLLGQPTLLANGTLQLTSSDVNGGTLSPADLPNFEAQASADLVNWVTLLNALSLNNGALLLQDNAQTNSTIRFYRIIEH